MRVAIAQIEVALDGEGDAGAAARRQAVATAADGFRSGADIVVLPEMSVPGYTTDRAVLAALAEPVPGPTTDALTEVAAAAHGLVVVGLAERSNGHIFDTAVAVSDDGVIAHYRKLHLFDREKDVFAPGDLGLPVVDSAFGRIGLCICYDLRFVEVLRILALRGAELICAPAAWVRGFDTSTGEVPGQVQGAVVQANLNQVFVACPSQVGQPGDHRFLGCSVVVDPFGDVLAGPLSATEPGLAVADVDLDRCAEAQARSPRITPRADRRGDVYGIAYGGQRL